MRLALAVKKFISSAKRSPALAVGDALTELEHEADRSFDGAFAALHAPIADYTWQVRVILAAADPDATSDEVRLGEPVEIVGMQPTLLLVDSTKILPPMEAIDAQILIDRKDNFTSTMRRKGASSVDTLVNLPMLGVQVPRLLGLHADKTEDPILTMKFRWAVDTATVTAFGWGDTQISCGFFVRPKNTRC